MKTLLDRLRRRPRTTPPRDWTNRYSPRDWADLPTYHPRRDEDSF